MLILQEDDDDNSIEEVIDNDEGEDLHLQKRAQKDESVDKTEDEDDEEESGSSKFTVQFHKTTTFPDILL